MDPALSTATGPVGDAGLVGDVVAWYASAARDLPWRRPGTDAWAVLVCEVMSHQTPVARVVPAWRAWLERWPTPTALADDSPGEAIRMWGRLGYPRRALRLHAAAVAVRDDHGGQVPAGYHALLGLPGVGPYTAGATAAFAFGRRAVVLDVNIRRVLARVHDGVDALPSAPTKAEVARAERLLPTAPEGSVAWNAAVMELGAVVCTARSPRCDVCPVRPRCAWAAAADGADGADAAHEADAVDGADAADEASPSVATRGPAGTTGRNRTRAARTTRPQAWVGTDRYVRGLLLAVLREDTGVVPPERLEAVWPDDEQTARCLTGLLADGLAEAARGGYRLPS